MVRAAAADGQLRAFAVTGKQLVETARQLHGTSPVATAALGRLLCAGAMMGFMMKGGKDLLTLQAKGDGPIGGLLVTADSHGNVKGFADNPAVLLPLNAKGKLDVGGALGKGILRVVKDMGMKEPYVGQTELQTGEIAEDLTWYFASSEQIPSSVGLGVLVEKDWTVRQAGGFLIQLLPGAEESIAEALEQKLLKMDSVTAYLDRGCTPEQLLEELLGEFSPEILDRREIRFQCGCSRERAMKVAASIGRRDLEEILREGKPVEITCHFCNKAYEFTGEDLKEILKSPAKKQEL